MSGKYGVCGNNRKIRIWIVAVIAALSIFTFTAAAVSQVILQPSSGTISEDETVTVDVFVVSETEIAGMQFDLEFNGSLLQATNVTEGDLFRQNSKQTFFNAGRVHKGKFKNVYGCVLGEGGVSTSGVFATVTLSSISGGNNTSKIYLENVIISSPEGKAVETKVVNASIEILKREEQEIFLKKLFLNLFGTDPKNKITEKYDNVKK